MRPVSIVEGDGFQEFIHEVNPRYQIPSRGTVSNRIVKLYENVKTTIEDMNVALMTERRTSLATDAYVTVPAHLITDDWEMKNFVFKTGEVRESHTTENMADCIMDGLGEFGEEKNLCSLI